jgi:hypothetical protein
MLKIKINGSKSEITYDMLDVSSIAYTNEDKEQITVSCDNHRLTDGSVVRFTRQGQSADAHENRTVSVVDKDTFVVDSFKPYDITFEGMRIESVATGFDAQGELVYRSAFVLDLPEYIQFITTHDYSEISAVIGDDYYDSDEDDESYKCPGDIITFNGLVYNTDENELDEHNRYIFPNDPSQCLNYKEIDIIFYNDLLQRECVVNGGIIFVDDYGNDINEHVYFFCERGSEDDAMLRNLMSSMPFVTIRTTDKRFYNDNNGEVSFIVRQGIQESYIEKKVGDYRISIPIGSEITNDIRTEDVQQQFLSNKVEQSINNIVDYEKKQFEPVRYKYPIFGQHEADFSDNVFENIDEIVFNLHFRERYDNPDEGKEWATSDIDGWNNYYIGEDQSHNAILVPKQSLDITDADVLKYLNFTDADVYFQKSRLKKSFLRLLFYDSPDRGKQVLQYYSTIFFDTGDTFSKYVKAKSEEKDGEEHDGISDESTYYVSNEHASNKDLRLCARFKTWSNKNMKHSSDGFYAYLYPSLIEGTMASDLFLKVEFNHAKYGRTIPFILPTYSNGYRILPIDPTNPSASDGHYFPIHYMKLDNETGEYSEVDFQKALDDMYINVKIKYDETNNRYVWFFPRPKLSYENDTQIVLNLFEPRLNGYEKLPSDTIYDNIPSDAIISYDLNIVISNYNGLVIDDFYFTASMDGEVVCQRVVKKGCGAECHIQNLQYKSNVAMFNFLFEMTNSMNYTTAEVLCNGNVLVKKSLHGKYNEELTCDIDLSTMIINNALNIEVVCKN